MVADDYLCNLVPYVHISETNLRLRDIYHHGRWNFSHLTTQIPLSIQLQIRSIFIDESSQDIKIWTHSPTGMYSVKSCYQWLTSNSLSFAGQTQLGTCQWIWKLNLLENLKHFIWLAMYGNLPTNAYRAGRHLTSYSSCKRCGASIESLLHTFKDCPLSLAI